jgi:large subunit ribosomal protein L31
MKKEIHPEYFEKAKIVCACGAAYQIGSTMPEISVELCAACHPFYTGKQKIIDTARRVEKFGEKMTRKTDGAAAAKKAKQAARTAKKKEKASTKAS